MQKVGRVATASVVAYLHSIRIGSWVQYTIDISFTLQVGSSCRSNVGLPFRGFHLKQFFQYWDHLETVPAAAVSQAVVVAASAAKNPHILRRVEIYSDQSFHSLEIGLKKERAWS